MATLMRFVFMAVITCSTLLACNAFFVNSPLSSPNQLETVAPATVASTVTKESEPERLPDAPYLQTPMAAVQKMLQMANVKETDVVCDLGSGDGRIAIAAAQMFGAKAIGIEIDPELIRESDRELKLAIAKTPTIRDRIKFIQQDFFKADLRDVTVVTLYLLPEANLRVRNEILSKLKAGTKVISYEYDLGDLPPSQMEKIKIGDREQTIYLWVLS
ncbi:MULTISPECIES: methyltransferase domain-containing protein [Pseudanabaena]|uniref:Histone methylation DOT1 family protein n=2 Tax=Pseudanabaena TaxID=1152 RepID=L8MU01_9CYAN|nr:MULTISPECIES: methyltransferase domain-containing protein [Pseudanabaena]ELS30921.1 Histone methylation DOT1 family protein [Pseudanabaena biceps PCC 7429]MDG3496814.1 methyltransferase domain-containing protein [Pseudanabaena catenata USMAC16]